MERVKALYQLSAVHAHVDGYCHEMPAAYAAADLVVCRAGASTVWELIAVRKPAILVPYPLATGQHQSENARLLADAGAGMVREQRDLAESGISGPLEQAMSPEVLGRMTAAYARLGIDPFLSAGKIRELVVSAAKKS